MAASKIPKGKGKGGGGGRGIDRNPKGTGGWGFIGLEFRTLDYTGGGRSKIDPYCSNLEIKLVLSSHQ